MPCSVREGWRPETPGSSREPCLPRLAGAGTRVIELDPGHRGLQQHRVALLTHSQARPLLGTVVEFPSNRLHLKTCLRAQGKQILFET